MNNEKKPSGQENLTPAENAAENQIAEEAASEQEEKAAQEAAPEQEAAGETDTDQETADTDKEADAEQETDTQQADAQPEAGEEPENETDGLLKKDGKANIAGFFKSSRFRHGGIATAFTAGFIVVIVLLNIVVSILGDRFPSVNLDLTAGNTNTLSEDAQKVVDSVKIPTTIKILASEEDVKNDAVLSSSYGLKYSQVGILASKMQERNPNIKVEYVDLDKTPTFATNYQNDSLTAGCVVVETEKRHRVLQVTDLFNVQQDYQTGASQSYSTVDGALASAVNQTNSETLPVVAFATGHDELLDASGFKSLLAGGSFETVSFNLLTEPVPEKAQMIVLATPSTDFTAEELKKLDTFLSDSKLEASRSLFITFHPSQDALPNLSNFLREWGIEVPRAVVMETDQTKLSQNDPTYILTQTGMDSDIDFESGTTDYGYVTMPQSSPINLLFQSQDGVSTHALAASYDSSYLVDESTSANSEPKKASYTTLALAQKYMTINNKSYQQNVVVAGSSLMFSSGYLTASTFGNGKYTLDLAKYVTGTTNNDSGVVITPVQTSVTDITLTAAASNILGIGVFTLLIPLAVLLAGVVVFLKRRHL